MQASDAIGAMLTADAAERPSMDAVLEHPLFWTLSDKVRWMRWIGRLPSVCDPRLPTGCGWHCTTRRCRT